MRNSSRKRTRTFSRKADGVVRVLRIVTMLVVALIVVASGYAVLRPGKLPAEETVDPEWLNVGIPEDVAETKLFYTGFNVSFNPVWHVPNYVAWELTGEKTHGSVARNSRFAQDCSVDGCATLDDYRRSGFDRGHMAPAADMKWSQEAMTESHLLTNIVPQDHKLNSGRWNSLEQKSRTIARRDSIIIIIAGPVLSDRIVRTIGESEVAVPERFFKVLFSPFADPPQAIAFVLPNRQIQDPLSALTMSVDQLEEITGFDFFSSLPDSIEETMERNSKPGFWEVY